MDQKRELSSVDLAALTTELQSYEGAKVDKAYLYDDSMVRLRMRDFDRGRVELLIEVGDPKRLHVADPSNVSDAPGRPPNFAMMLRNRISGADFAGVEQYEFDRIVTLRFERPDGDTLIIAELFGDGNVVVCNAEYEVIDCLETIRLSSRTVAPGARYEYPQSRFDPLEASRDEFVAQMESSDTDIVRTLATQLNLGGLWAEELCSRAGIEKTKPIEDAGDTEYRALFRVVEDLRSSLSEGAFDPHVYYEDDAIDATPVPLAEHEELESEQFDSFNAALDEYFAHLDEEGEGAETAAQAEPDRPDFEAEIEKFERIIEQQQGAIESFEEDAAQERRKAELLYENYDLVAEVLTAVQNARREDRSWDEIRERFEEGSERDIPAANAIEAVSGSEATVTVELDETAITIDTTTGVEKNADLLYQEAKRIEEKREGALAAIEDTRENLEAVKQRRNKWEASDEKEDLEEQSDETTPEEWLSRSSIPVRRDEQWYESFRWFHTSDGFLVIGGRNADQNEDLVKKYMEGSDLFFHAQAHGAPVTILKATGPSEAARDVDIPERSREEAAQFAVSYSSVWKDGHYSGDVYMATPDQVSKTPESGEFIEKGSFVIRGDRTYYRDTAVAVSVGIACEPQTRVLGGPPSAIEDQTVTSIDLEPGRYAQNDIAKLLYREFGDRFEDQSFLRKVASPDQIQEFCPAGGSRIVNQE